MALNECQILPCDGASLDLLVGGLRNDAFSFWKLADNWRQALQLTIAPSESIAEWYLLERYLPERERRPPPGMWAYYAVKGMIPGWLRHQCNSLVIRARRRRNFPGWPYETALLDFWQTWLHKSLQVMGETDGWHIGFWPNNKTCCIVLTHDVESNLGVERMEQMAELEDKYGFRSSWNLPLSQYPIDWRRVERVRARGFEIGAHGLSHDGKLFRNYKNFSALAPSLERLARERALPGFRAPSTLRRLEWIKSMNFDFDCSFSDSDPYEPQPGGTCSIFPFHIGEMVELPYTLPQDHTLIHLLRSDPLPVWENKARWIAARGGMILSLVHPDYCGAGAELELYEELLKRLNDIDSSWRALPSQVASWWRQRARLGLVVHNGEPSIVGTDREGAVARRLSSEPLFLAGRD